MELLSKEPNDKTIYNKMTKYFTTRLQKKSNIVFVVLITEQKNIYIGASDDDISFLKRLWNTILNILVSI